MKELKEKMEKIEKLVEAEQVARQTFVREPTYNNSVAIQMLKRQRHDIMRTLPPLREAV